MSAYDALPTFESENGLKLMMSDITYKSIALGPATRTFLDGSERWVVELPTIRIGIRHFRPGWVWSNHAGAHTSKESEAHIGYIQSGAMAVEGHNDQFSTGQTV